MSGREFVVLGRQWCHLCDDLVDQLRPIAEEAGWSIRVLDVDADPELEAKWDELVPVLLADGRELCHYHLDEVAVRAHVAEFG
jgi:thiol-disulfide isomerase/thioredoxin